MIRKDEYGAFRADFGIIARRVSQCVCMPRPPVHCWVMSCLDDPMCVPSCRSIVNSSGNADTFGWSRNHQSCSSEVITIVAEAIVVKSKGVVALVG